MKNNLLNYNHLLPFIYIIVISLLVSSCNSKAKDENHIQNTKNEQKQIAKMLDDFNEAAANADFNSYFDCFADDAVFIGTDATENWDKEAFMIWAKPYFDKKTTWDFKSIDRNIYFDKTGKIAWFDELLDTQMKLCRGSGVVIKQGKEWKIKQYVLSMTVPNALTDTVVKLKAPIEHELIIELSKNQ